MSIANDTTSEPSATAPISVASAEEMIGPRQMSSAIPWTAQTVFRRRLSGSVFPSHGVNEAAMTKPYRIIPIPVIQRPAFPLFQTRTDKTNKKKASSSMSNRAPKAVSHCLERETRPSIPSRTKAILDTVITHHRPDVVSGTGLVTIAAIGTIRHARKRVMRFA